MGQNEEIYIEHGYNNRNDYLNCLAEDYGIDNNIVYSLAELLGEDEDFDGLINSLEDFYYFY